MRYLVTGCAGFIGSTLTDALLADGHDVIGVDCFTPYYNPARKHDNLRGAHDSARFELHQLDLASAPLDHLVDGVDGIFHHAAQAGVRASWGDDFSSYVNCNILATQRLLESVVRSGTGAGSMPRLVYASSSSVYGNALQLPTHEDALPAPVSPYGVSKLAAEHLCSTYHHNYGIDVVSLRYFTVYGERQRPDMAFHRFIRAALTDEPIVVYGDGHQSRDFTYVGDIVTANRSAMSHDTLPGVYNLGGGSIVTVREVIDHLREITGRDIDVQWHDTQPGDVVHTSADTAAARSHLGYTPATSLHAGLARQVAWMQRALQTS
jgi:nucleoside-diphosphate-sugar epimerase